MFEESAYLTYFFLPQGHTLVSVRRDGGEAGVEVFGAGWYELEGQ